MFKCPAISQVENDTIGQTDARFRRVAHSLGLEVCCGVMTFDKFLNRKYSALQARLSRTVPNRVEVLP